MVRGSLSGTISVASQATVPGGRDERVFSRCRFCSRDGGRAMRGSLGEKIGEGTMADIHAWAPGQVLKLFKADVPQRTGRHEAQMTRAVFAAGAPAPEVFDEVTVDGRFGI